MSDSHELCSHPLRPARPPALVDMSPTLTPCTVMLVEAVAATLALHTTLPAGGEAETPLVALPARLPAVKTAHLLPVPPSFNWHRTDVSAAQLVRSHAVGPMDAAADTQLAIPPPTSVKLIDPVTAELAFKFWLTEPTAMDTISDALPASTPTDTDARRLASEPCPAFPRTDVSDSQDVRSPTDPPRASCAEYALRPTFLPRTVTLVDPVAAQLVRAVKLSRDASCDTPCVALPLRAPTVTSSSRLLSR